MAESVERVKGWLRQEKPWRSPQQPLPDDCWMMSENPFGTTVWVKIPPDIHLGRDDIDSLMALNCDWEIEIGNITLSMDGARAVIGSVRTDGEVYLELVRDNCESVFCKPIEGIR